MSVIKEWAEKCFRRRSRGASLIKDPDGTAEDINLLSVGEPLEEETIPGFAPADYYPIRIGQVLCERYTVLGKLGYSASSTTWFCNDRKTRRHVEVKVCTALPADGRPSRDEKSHREWRVYSRLSGMESDNPGVAYLRQILDRFTLVSKIGAEHYCFVYPPSGLNLADFHRLAPNADMSLLKDILRAMLHSLDFLHTDARIMHTNLRPECVFFTVSSRATLELFAKRLNSQAPSGKHDPDGNRNTYRSVKFTDLLQLDELSFGRPVLGELGEARILKRDDELLLPMTVLPDPSHAPEICLNMSWSFAVDVWSFAVIAWLLLARQPLFTASDGKGRWSNTKHLKQMFALLGAPPEALVLGRQLWESFGEGQDGGGGNGKSAAVQSSALNVDDKFAWMDWNERTDLLDFMRSMLKWKAEERKTAKELLEHPFLKEDRRLE